MKCMAADFFIPGVEKSRLIAFAYRNSLVGGLGCYPGRTFIHIDVRDRPAGWTTARHLLRLLSGLVPFPLPSPAGRLLLTEIPACAGMTPQPARSHPTSPSPLGTGGAPGLRPRRPWQARGGVR